MRRYCIGWWLLALCCFLTLVFGLIIHAAHVQSAPPAPIRAIDQATKGSKSTEAKPAHYDLTEVQRLRLQLKQKDAQIAQQSVAIANANFQQTSTGRFVYVCGVTLHFVTSY
jgi:hypothetical protein